MKEMFKNASSFNQPLEQWNVGNVTYICEMFYGASAFNQPIGEWNVANVTNMEGKFYYASAFNQPIGNWNVDNIYSIMTDTPMANEEYLRDRDRDYRRNRLRGINLKGENLSKAEKGKSTNWCLFVPIKLNFAVLETCAVVR